MIIFNRYLLVYQRVYSIFVGSENGLSFLWNIAINNWDLTNKHGCMMV